MKPLLSAVPTVFRVTIAASICVAAVCGQQVKTRLYSDSKECFNTYHVETGRILTSHGVVEDPTINAMVKEAVGTQMSALKIGGADDKSADLVVRFTGGNGAGVQIDDFAMGTYAVWDLGGSVAVSSRTYKKTALVIVLVERKSNRAVWAALCVDKFGDPGRAKE